MNSIYTIRGETLTNLADAVREKTGKTNEPAGQEIALDELFSIENSKEAYSGCENPDETLEPEVIVDG